MWLAIVFVKNKFNKKLSSFNQFVSLVSIYTPPENIRKHLVFLMFSVDIKDTSGMKWVNYLKMTLTFHDRGSYHIDLVFYVRNLRHERLTRVEETKLIIRKYSRFPPR